MSRYEAAVFPTTDRVGRIGALRVDNDAATAPETTAIAVDGLSVQIDVTSGIDGQNTACRAIPRLNCETGGQCGIGILRHTYYLVSLFAHGIAASAREITVGQTPTQVDRAASGKGGTACRCNGPFVGAGHKICTADAACITRNAKRHCGGDACVGRAIAVAVGVGAVDVRALHLDEQQQVARLNISVGTGGGTNRQKSRPRHGTDRAGEKRIGLRGHVGAASLTGNRACLAISGRSKHQGSQ